MKNTNLKNFVSILLVILIILYTIITGLVTYSYATDETTSNELKIERISHPDATSGIVDGLENEGNRETSYAWAMAERGDYIYVGTNKNIIGGVASSFINAMVVAGVTEDAAWTLVNSLTNNEIPRPTTNEGGYIFKCNKTTGEITKIYTAEKGVAFRMAIEFEDNLYFATYSAEAGADNFIYKIDVEDNITTAFTSSNGTSLRAACIHENSLYFGGVDAREELDEGDDETHVKLAIVKKDATDDTKWDRVADYKDFKEYSTDPAVASTIASPIWDICSYDGYIWATIPNNAGAVVYKGHPATGDETANEYGWYWSEVVGKNNGINNIGLAEISEGYTGDASGLLTVCTTPFVFKDKLYMIDFDHTIYAEVSALTGLMYVITNQDVDLTPYLKPMYTTLNHPQTLWCYDDATGKFNKVETFSPYMQGNCNEYLWRAETYNDELYITTMDSAVIYKYILQFKGKNFTSLTEEEVDSLIAQIDQGLTLLGNLGTSSSEVSEAKTILETIKAMLEEYKLAMNDSDKFNEFVVKYEKLIIQMEKLSTSSEGTGNSIIDSVLNSSTSSLKELYDKVNWEALKMYACIVRMVTNDNQGFDMLKTADGENFEIVTDTGFDDPYNYGGRSLCATDQGLYLGTANPFYGAQLWRITNETTSQEPGEETPGEETPGEEKPGEEKPGEEKPGEEKPGEEKPGEETPGEEKPGEEKPGNNTIPDTNIDDISKELEDKIKDYDKFMQELEVLKEQYTTLTSQDIINAKVNSTESSKVLPKTGKYGTLIAIGVTLAIGGFTCIKYLKYRDIK